MTPATWLVIATVAVGVMVLIYFSFRSAPAAAEVLAAPLPSGDTIFVSIPEYRDSEAAYTICNVFSEATHPHNVFVGICSQRDLAAEQSVLDDVAALLTYSTIPEEYGMRFTRNVRRFLAEHVVVEYVDKSLAKGPTVARAAIERSLWKNERFTLMIDSHTRVMKGWDVYLVDYLQRCPSGKPILTLDPFDYGDRGACRAFREREPPSFLYVDTLAADTDVPLLNSRQFATAPVAPILQLFWTPKFSFTYSAAHREVPTDPHLKHLAAGDEILMSARLWCAGWDFFAPDCMAAKHLADRSYRPTVSELRKSSRVADQRVQGILGIRLASTIPAGALAKAAKYSPAGPRSVAEYSAFCDVKFSPPAVGKRAFLGLSPGAAAAEVVAKFGGSQKLKLAESVYARGH